MFSIHVDDDIRLAMPEPRYSAANYALIDRNRTHISRFMSWLTPEYDSAAEQRWQQSTQQAFADGRGLDLSIFWRDELAGVIGLRIDRLHRLAEIGYWLDERLTGQGIVTRSVRTLMHYGFGVLGLNRIFLRCAPDNAKSCAIAERVGMQYEGTLRQCLRIGEQFLDLKYYGMVRGEWQAPDEPEPILSWRIDDDLELRLLEERHAEAVFALTDANRDHLRPWLPWVDATRSVEDTLSFIQSALRQFARGDGWHAGLWWRGELAGCIGYHGWNFVRRDTEIGYWLGQSFTGKGLITRAAHAMTDYAINAVGLNRVVICCAVGNERSCAVPRRLGFTHEGIQRQGIWTNGVAQDIHVHAVLAADWLRTTTPVIYHIISAADWQAAQDSGVYQPPSLDKEGFIHCSRRGQVTHVANAFYCDVPDLLLLCIDTTRLNANLIWEAPAHPEEEDDAAPAPPSKYFPHIYGPLNLDAVTSVVPFPFDARGTFILPEDLPG